MINVSDQHAQHAPRSLIVTLYGAYGRFAPGPVPVAELIRLLATVGVDAPSVRSSVSRLKRRGLLLPARTADGAAGYELSAEARQLLDDGDRRIYATAPYEDEGWVLAVFSVPESERQKRHVLRSRLAGLGFGTAAPGVWIAPARLYEETRHALGRLGLDSYVDFFRGEHLGFTPTAEAVPRRRRPTATTSSPWTPGATCPTPTPVCPPGCCPRGGPARARRPSSTRCTTGCATRGRSTRHSTIQGDSRHICRRSRNPQPSQTLFSGSSPTVRTHEPRT
jgi:hypothetical protein